MEVSGKKLETELCESCATENLSKPADGFCKDCNEFMCQKCFRHHLKVKFCRKHILDPLNGASSQGAQQIQEGKCKKHAQETIKYFCRTHKSVICGDCIVSEHQKCAIEFIKDLAKNYKESSEFKTMVRQIQKLETDTAENKTRIERSRKENKTLLENALKGIHNFHREIHVWLDKIENILEVEVRKIYDDNENLLLQLNEKITNISSEIDRIKEELNSYLYQADNLFIRSVEYQSRIGDVDKSVSEVKPNIVIKTYAFEPEISERNINIFGEARDYKRQPCDEGGGETDD